MLQRRRGDMIAIRWPAASISAGFSRHICDLPHGTRVSSGASCDACRRLPDGNLGLGQPGNRRRQSQLIESQMDMSVGPTCTVKDTNPPPQNDGTVAPDLVKAFNDALNGSADSNDASHAQCSKDDQGSQQTGAEGLWANLSQPKL